MIAIDAADDPRIAAFTDVRTRTDWRTDNTIVVESVLAIQRLFDSGLSARAVLVVDKRTAALEVPEGVEVFTCSQAVLDAIVRFPMHRGAIAIADRPRTPIASLCRRFEAPRAVVVCASGVSDPSNLGSIARNCRALGADGILVDPRGGDIYARKAIRASMGNVFAQTVVMHDVSSAIDVLKTATPELCVAAATLSPHSIDVRAFKRPPKLLLVVGNEGDGIPSDVLAKADVELNIPMHGGTDSLNVAVATAVFLYALVDSR